MLDIEILRVLWWVLLGVLLMGFAVTDGFDFGVAILLPLVARDETGKTCCIEYDRTVLGR